MKYAWIEARAGWQPIARLCKVLDLRQRAVALGWSIEQVIVIDSTSDNPEHPRSIARAFSA